MSRVRPGNIIDNLILHCISVPTPTRCVGAVYFLRPFRTCLSNSGLYEIVEWRERRNRRFVMPSQRRASAGRIDINRIHCKEKPPPWMDR